MATRPGSAGESAARRLLKSLARIALAVAIGYYVVVGGFVWLTQDSLVYAPPRGLRITPADLGLTYEEVRLTTRDGLKLHGWWVPQPVAPSDAPDAPPVLLYFHGNAENISNLGYALTRWHEAGFETLAVDYRGYGQSQGEPDEEGTYLDALAAWRHLEERQVAADRIVVWGRSLGGAVATWLASRHTPAALVLQSTFTSATDLGGDLYPWLPVRWLSRYRYDSEELLPRVACPVLIAHSPDDEIVPFRHAQELFAAAGEPKRLLRLGGGHNDGAEALELVPRALEELMVTDRIVSATVSD